MQSYKKERPPQKAPLKLGSLTFANLSFQSPSSMPWGASTEAEVFLKTLLGSVSTSAHELP